LLVKKKPSTSTTTTAPKTTTVGNYPTLPSGGGNLQPMPVNPYSFYPQQPIMLGQGGMPMQQYAQYIPLQNPGAGYILQPAQKH